MLKRSLSKLILLFLAALVLTFLSSSIRFSPAISIPPPVDASMLENSWKLRQWDLANASKPPLNGASITAEFSNNRVGGSGGCNHYQGIYQKGSSVYAMDTLTIGEIVSTKKSCPSPIMVQESDYFTALQGAKRYEITGLAQLRISYKTTQGSGVLEFELQPQVTSRLKD